MSGRMTSVLRRLGFRNGDDGGDELTAANSRSGSQLFGASASKASCAVPRPTGHGASLFGTPSSSSQEEDEVELVEKKPNLGERVAGQALTGRPLSARSFEASPRREDEHGGVALAKSRLKEAEEDDEMFALPEKPVSENAERHDPKTGQGEDGSRDVIDVTVDDEEEPIELLSEAETNVIMEIARKTGGTLFSAARKYQEHEGEFGFSVQTQRPISAARIATEHVDHGCYNSGNSDKRNQCDCYGKQVECPCCGAVARVSGVSKSTSKSGEEAGKYLLRAECEVIAVKPMAAPEEFGGFKGTGLYSLPCLNCVPCKKALEEEMRKVGIPQLPPEAKMEALSRCQKCGTDIQLNTDGTGSCPMCSATAGFACTGCPSCDAACDPKLNHPRTTLLSQTNLNRTAKSREVRRQTEYQAKVAKIKCRALADIAESSGGKQQQAALNILDMMAAQPKNMNNAIECLPESHRRNLQNGRIDGYVPIDPEPTPDDARGRYAAKSKVARRVGDQFRSKVAQISERGRNPRQEHSEADKARLERAHRRARVDGDAAARVFDDVTNKPHSPVDLCSPPPSKKFKTELAAGCDWTSELGNRLDSIDKNLMNKVFRIGNSLESSTWVQRTVLKHRTDNPVLEELSGDEVLVVARKVVNQCQVE